MQPRTPPAPADSCRAHLSCSLSPLTKLQDLRLYDNHIRSLAGLQGLVNLHSLDVSSNLLTSLEVRASAQVGSCHRRHRPLHARARGACNHMRAGKAAPPCLPAPPPHTPHTAPQGLAGLRSLRVLRAAHNALPSLDSLAKFATGLEALDVGHNRLTGLGGLAACTALTELVVTGNALQGLQGLGRCGKLMELHAAGNALTSLHGLRGAAGALDVRRGQGRHGRGCTAVAAAAAAHVGSSSAACLKTECACATLARRSWMCPATGCPAWRACPRAACSCTSCTQRATA